MKVKILMFLSFLTIAGLFSGCTKEVVETDLKKQNSSLAENSLVRDSSQVANDNRRENAEERETNSIKNLLDLKENIKCNWRTEKAELVEEAEIDNEDEGATGGIEDGSIYVANGKFFQEMKIQENSRENTVKILNDGKWIYQWSSIVNQGTKMTIKKAQKMEAIDFNKKFSWNCENWVVDESLFEIPKNIKFINL